MRHLEIKSSAELTEIDIFGQIGDSFFEDGNTLDTVKAELKNVKTELIINIASLGGIAFEGLAIHDLIASHPFNTTVNIIGATASAGAIISVAGDTVNISENSLFLVHNSHGMAMGNADDLENSARDMRKIDDRMVSIFTKRTGKSEETIRDLMAEDKFLDSEESKELGFVDNITKSVKVAANLNREKILNSKLTENQKEQLLNNPKSKTMDLTPITTQLKDLTDKVTAFITSNKEVKIADEKEITAKISEIDETFETLGTENQELSNSITALTEEKETLAEANKTLTDELAKYKATPTEVEPKTDTEPTEETETTEGAFGNTLKSIVSARVKGY